MQRLTRYISDKVPVGQYTAAACAVWCFDARFGRLARLFESYQTGPVDFVAIAGGAKALTEAGPACDYVLEQIAASLRLHQTQSVVLMVHENCGAYGRDFSTPEETRAFYLAELEKASRAVRDFLKRSGAAVVPIRNIYADFEGLWDAGSS